MCEKDMQKELPGVELRNLRGLLDVLILQFLQDTPISGYQIITDLRTQFGVAFGPNMICSLLGSLEEKGYIQSRWDFKSDQPYKLYIITTLGQNLLTTIEESLDTLLRRFSFSH